jgi:hypothetical protein
MAGRGAGEILALRPSILKKEALTMVLLHLTTTALRLQGHINVMMRQMFHLVIGGALALRRRSAHCP